MSSPKPPSSGNSVDAGSGWEDLGSALCVSGTVLSAVPQRGEGWENRYLQRGVCKVLLLEWTAAPTFTVQCLVCPC
jgi:hypothetical protein